jgi:hopanoid biosynthesis associated protein HpnK
VKLVLNADDFGRSGQINRAVERAHREGVLNSASLMIAGEAAEEAAEIARRNPDLSIGLHLVVVDGPSVLSAPFANRPVQLGLSYQLRRSARQKLSSEIGAQFERFAKTGLPMAHVDGHQHMHMHPAVFDLVLPLAEKFGARRLRIIRDDLRLALRHDSRQFPLKSMSGMIFMALARRCLRRMRGTTLWSGDRTYGFFQSGMMDQKYVLSVLAQARDSDEIYFHPTEGERVDQLGPNPIDLATLLSPQTRLAVEKVNSAASRMDASPPSAPLGVKTSDAASWTRA